ncbi:MAG: hypothetical protein RXS19_03530 [Caldisphaera sp.]|jgi:Cytosine deaminase and related metal-dependent hydrolases|uniref:hypothetical protein n=1 Tax=Caldisphaera sp. TaxID=2060322 RepID=UPI00397ABA81
MVSILITGSSIFTGKELIRDGYVFIDDGKIKEVGTQPVPDEMSEPSLVLGGKGRIIAPSLTAIADISTFLIRFFNLKMNKRIELYKMLSKKDLFTLSLPSIYELNMHGVTTIFAESIDVSYIIDLQDKLGGFFGIAAPSCVNNISVPPSLSGKIEVKGYGCDGNGISEDSNDYLTLLGKGSYSLSKIDNVYEKSEKIRAIAGLPPNIIKENNKAEIIVYDTSRPPAMNYYKGTLDYIKNIYNENAIIESLLAGEDVLIDIGGHLRIGQKHLKEAESLIEKIVSNEKFQQILA